MNIIIANSVGVDKNGYHIVHSPSRWSLGVKNYTDCIYYPWELSYASSYLKQKFPEHNIKMLDGVLNSYTFEEYIKVISEYNPDVLVMEPSARTYETDKLFAISVKEKFNAKIIFCGGLSTAEPEKLLEVADYVLQGEYEETLLELLKTNFDESIEGLYPNNRRKIIDINTLPFPEDDDVSRIKYFEPNCEYKEIQFYISRGCPMKCNFCVAGNLYYEKPNWRPRSIQNIIAEIKYLKNKYPEMEGLFLDEEVHNINKKFVLEFCDALIKNNLQHLKIDAMSEYYLLDEEILYKMKEAGYYKLRVGIETASDKIAKKMNLGNKFNLNKLFEVLEIANKIGMKMYGTFTVGGLGSNKNEDLKTVNLIYNLISNNLLNDLQVSINTPQPGTPFYIEAKEKKYFITEDWQSFDGGKGSVLSYPDYSKSEIDSMFKTALNKYDEALKIRAENFKFDLKIKNNLDMIIKPNSKILIIRSYRMWLVDILIDILLKRFKCGIIYQEEVQNLIIKHNFYKKYCYGNGFIKIDNFTSAMLNEINDEQYDYIIVPVRNIRINNYYNVQELLDSLNVKNKILVDSFGEIKELK